MLSPAADPHKQPAVVLAYSRPDGRYRCPAMRMTVPQANPSLYISSALAVTFPFNVVIGIPMYLTFVKHLIPAG